MEDYFDFPFHFDARNRTAATDGDDHVRDMIYQVLFTTPGERINRPDFGCGLRTLVFMPNSEALAAATKVLVKGALQRWLEAEIQVEEVDVKSQDSQLMVTVVYTRRDTGEHRTDQFTGVA